MFKPLTQLNYFFRLATERKLSGSDQLMYLHLFNKFNQAHWTETLQIKDAELKDLMRLYDSNGKPATIETVRRARQRLKAKGFIEYTSGDGQEPKYQLPCLYPEDTPADTPADTPEDTPEDTPAAPYIRAREDVKTLDVKTSIYQSMDARAREDSDLDEVVEYWDELKGGRLTFEHQSALNVYLQNKGVDWVKSAMKEAADANSNPRGLSPKFLFGVMRRKATSQPLKGGEKSERPERIDYGEEPDYSWIK